MHNAGEDELDVSGAAEEERFWKAEADKEVRELASRTAPDWAKLAELSEQRSALESKMFSAREIVCLPHEKDTYDAVQHLVKRVPEAYEARRQASQLDAEMRTVRQRIEAEESKPVNHAARAGYQAVLEKNNQAYLERVYKQAGIPSPAEEAASLRKYEEDAQRRLDEHFAQREKEQEQRWKEAKAGWGRLWERLTGKTENVDAASSIPDRVIKGAGVEDRRAGAGAGSSRFVGVQPSWMGTVERDSETGSNVYVPPGMKVEDCRPPKESGAKADRSSVRPDRSTKPSTPRGPAVPMAFGPEYALRDHQLREAAAHERYHRNAEMLAVGDEGRAAATAFANARQTANRFNLSLLGYRHPNIGEAADKFSAGIDTLNSISDPGAASDVAKVAFQAFDNIAARVKERTNNWNSAWSKFYPNDVTNHFRYLETAYEKAMASDKLPIGVKEKMRYALEYQAKEMDQSLFGAAEVGAFAHLEKLHQEPVPSSSGSGPSVKTSAPTPQASAQPTPAPRAPTLPFTSNGMSSTGHTGGSGPGALLVGGGAVGGVGLGGAAVALKEGVDAAVLFACEAGAFVAPVAVGAGLAYGVVKLTEAGLEDQARKEAEQRERKRDGQAFIDRLTRMKPGIMSGATRRSMRTSVADLLAWARAQDVSGAHVEVTEKMFRESLAKEVLRKPVRSERAREQLIKMAVALAPDYAPALDKLQRLHDASTAPTP